MAPVGHTATQARQPTHSFLSSITTPWGETVRALTGHSATQSRQVWLQTLMSISGPFCSILMQDRLGSSTLKNSVEQAVMHAPQAMHLELSHESRFGTGTPPASPERLARLRYPGKAAETSATILPVRLN